MILKFSKQKILLFFLLFFWMFSPVLLVFGIKIKMYIFTVIIPAVLGINKYSKNKQMNVSKYILISMIVGFVYTLVAEFFGVLKGIVDFSFTKDYIIGFAIFFSAYYIVSKYKVYYQDKYLDKILLHLFLVGVIHSLIILLLAIVPDIKELFYKFIWVTDKQYRYIFGDVFNRRCSGFLDTGFASLSAIHATLLAVGLLYFKRIKQKATFFKITSFLIGFIIIFLSLIFIGRSGFVVLLSYMIMYWVYNSMYVFKKFKFSFRAIKIFVLFILIFGVLLIAIDFEKYDRVILASFELINNYIETGHFSSYSTDVILENQLIFPNNIFNILFGTANFGRGSNIISSDLGMVYLVNGIGIFGTIIVFSSYFILLYYAFKIKSSFTLIFYFIVVFELLLIILNFKDLYFMAFSGVTKIFFIFVFLYHFIYLERMKTYDK